MAIYANLAKLGRVKLPSGSEYALIDVDGRSIIAPNFSAEASYNEGDHVIYGDNLYRFKTAKAAGDWNATTVDNVTVDTEIKRIEGLIAGGIHYRGKTSTALYEGATTNPISIGGSSYTASSGDLVIFDTTSTTVLTYATGTAYDPHTYIKNNGIIYITTAAISASENTSISAIESKINVIQKDPEFLFDGSKWNALGSIADGLGDLAFKDSASGSYTKPTGSGTVTIKNYSEIEKYLERTSIIGVSSATEAATLVSGGTTKNQWKADATNPTVVYGTADVGTAVTYGTANPGTAVTGVAQVDSQKTFTTAWSASNTTGAVTASVSGDCLQLGIPSTGNVYGVKDATGVSITPAVASNTTLTPAKAADSTRTINNLVADGTLKGSYTLTDKNLAVKNASATTVATGGVTTSADGAVVLTALEEGTESATVSVATTTDTVTVRQFQLITYIAQIISRLFIWS